MAEFHIHTKQTHSGTLMPMVESVLRLAGKTISDVDCLAVSAGPGSFTGVRIGVSCVKGLALSGEIPCAGISTLRALAENGRDLTGVLCCVMDARCGQVYNALFKAENGVLTRLCADRAISIEALGAECAAYGDALLLLGDGAVLCHKTFAAFGARLLSPLLRLQRASGVAFAAREAAENGKTISPDALMPLYLRLPQAERELKKRQEEKKNTGGTT